MDVKIKAVQAVIPEDSNIIVGQSHFIKTVEDLEEIIVSAVPGIQYGLAFNEASGPCLVRTGGNEPSLVEAAKENALATKRRGGEHLCRNCKPAADCSC